jgi:hypothetical protein
LVRAYESIRAGDLSLARSLIKEVIQASPGSERAWLMLSLAVEDPQQQADCLQRVLRLNPNNPTALARLMEITAAISEKAVEPAQGPAHPPPALPALSQLAEPTPQSAPWLYQPTQPGFDPELLRAALAARKTGNLSTATLLKGLSEEIAARDSAGRSAAQTQPAPLRAANTRPVLPLVPPPVNPLPAPAEPLSNSERVLRWLVPSLIGAWAVLILVALVVVFVSWR